MFQVWIFVKEKATSVCSLCRVHLKKVKYLVVVLRLCIENCRDVFHILCDCIPSGGGGVVADVYNAWLRKSRFYLSHFCADCVHKEADDLSAMHCVRSHQQCWHASQADNLHPEESPRPGPAGHHTKQGQEKQKGQGMKVPLLSLTKQDDCLLF